MKLSDVDRIIVIGVGGTGGYVVGPLARYLLSRKYAGQLILADADSFEAKNQSRQLFGLDFVGMNKAEYHHKVLTMHLPALADQVSYIDEYLGRSHVEELFEDNCVVINCADNNAIRKFVEDRLAELSDAIHICSGNELTTGQVQVAVRESGEWFTPTIFERSPKFANGDGDRSDMSCEELAVVDGGSQTIFANMTAAALILNFVGILFQNDVTSYICDSIFFNTNTQGFKNYGATLRRQSLVTN
jgi:molybdopterin/thiamine biosynthesis adenylyltransferase